jgi:stage IV sporulation protein A
MHEVRTKGYGIVSPGIDEMVLEEPKMLRQGNRYGIRLKASAPSIHMDDKKRKNFSCFPLKLPLDF